MKLSVSDLKFHPVEQFHSFVHFLLILLLHEVGVGHDHGQLHRAQVAGLHHRTEERCFTNTVQGSAVQHTAIHNKNIGIMFSEDRVDPFLISPDCVSELEVREYIQTELGGASWGWGVPVRINSNRIEK